MDYTILQGLELRYVEAVGYIEREGLESAIEMKPLIDGKEVMGVLGLKPGKTLKVVLEDVIAWQLRCPKGTREELCEYLISGKEKYVGV